MRNYDKYRNTKFIQKNEVEKGALVTIKEVTEENVAPDNQAEKVKFVIYFIEDYKPWAPGVETLEVIKNIAGTGNVDDWFGTKLVLFVDPNVSFQGKITGGIRCRAPKNQPIAVDNVPDPEIQNEPAKAQFCDECKNLKEECTCVLNGDGIPY